MFSNEVLNAIQEHAEAAFPNEAVGFVVNGVYEPKENTHLHPSEEFSVTDADYLDADERGLEAIVHSHPGGPDHPTLADMRQQQATAVPWGIVSVIDGVASRAFWWGDEVPVPDLVGREFRHGVTDCYSLVRDYFRLEKNVLLPDFPRDWEWWQNGEDLYTENFLATGFTPVQGDPQPGDCFLAQIRSPVPNHAGVYIGDGLVLHHLVNRLSRREPVFPWMKFITRWVRYNGGESA
jgi:cell wall-associated NlpC family hydrolase